MAATSRSALPQDPPSPFELAQAARRDDFDARLRQSLDARQPDARDWPQDQQQLQTLHQSADELQRQAAADPGLDDPRRRQSYARAHAAIDAARRNLYGKHGAPLLRAWNRQALGTQQQLENGDVDLATVAPDDLSAAITHATRHDAQSLDADSPPLQAARSLMRAAHAGRIGDAIPALNQLYATDLQGYVGKPAYDGGTLSAPPRIVAAHPNPNDPAQTVLVAQFTSQHPDGREGRFTRPLMMSGDHLLMHPQDAQDHPVLALDTRELIHHTLGLATALLATQHPAVRAALQQASPQQGGRNRFLLELSNKLGTHTYEPSSRYQVQGDRLIERNPDTGGIRGITPLPAAPGREPAGAAPAPAPAPAGAGDAPPAHSDPLINPRTGRYWGH